MVPSTVSATGGTGDDYVAGVLAEWSQRRPDLDMGPVGVVARINRLSRLLTAELDAVLAAYGLTSQSLATLAVLVRAGPPHRLPQRALQAALGRTSGGLSMHLDALETRGLLARVDDPADRRKGLVELLPPGAELFDRAVQAHLANEADLVAGLDAPARDQLAGLLARLLADLETPVGTRPTDDFGLTVAVRRPSRHRPSARSPELEGEVTVTRVARDSPAAAAGLGAGDVLTAAYGVPLRTGARLERQAAAARRAGRLVLTVRRGDEEAEAVLDIGNGAAAGEVRREP